MFWFYNEGLLRRLSVVTLNSESSEAVKNRTRNYIAKFEV